MQTGIPSRSISDSGLSRCFRRLQRGKDVEGLEQILSGRYFEIPKNQRGFSWTISNILVRHLTICLLPR